MNTKQLLVFRSDAASFLEIVKTVETFEGPEGTLKEMLLIQQEASLYLQRKMQLLLADENNGIEREMLFQVIKEETMRLLDEEGE